jgi:hypothetical protein
MSRSGLAELDLWRLFSTMTKIRYAGYLSLSKITFEDSRGLARSPAEAAHNLASREVYLKIARFAFLWRASGRSPRVQKIRCERPFAARSAACPCLCRTFRRMSIAAHSASFVSMSEIKSKHTDGVIQF